jgi:hypothetical protein
MLLYFCACLCVGEQPAKADPPVVYQPRWPITTIPDVKSTRFGSRTICQAAPNNALPVHFLLGAARNMIPLHSPLYQDNFPGMLLSAKKCHFAAAMTDPELRFGNRFPQSVAADQHWRRPQAVLWRFNERLLHAKRTSADYSRTEELCALLPYYTCSPFSAHQLSRGKSDCPCIASSALLADCRDQEQEAVAAATTKPAMAVLQAARRQMRWLPRDPFDGCADPLPAVTTKATRLSAIIEEFTNRSAEPRCTSPDGATLRNQCHMTSSKVAS